MDRDQWDLSPDSIARALEAFLPRSAGEVVREAFYGVRRFDDFLRHTGLTRAVLADRLRGLVADDMLERTTYQLPGDRARPEYRLTTKSLDLLPTVVALMQWADRWMPNRRGPTLVIRHRDCGADVVVEVRCAAGHVIEHASETSAEPGPGARRRRSTGRTGTAARADQERVRSGRSTPRTATPSSSPSRRGC